MQFVEVGDSPMVTETLTRWRALHPGMMVCALVPEALRDHVPAVQTQCRQIAAPLVGAIFPALVHNGQFRTDGIWLLRFDVAPWTRLVTGLPTSAAGMERTASDWVQELMPQLQDKDECTLLMLFDAMVPNIASLLDALYLKLANRVHYAGANAGSETFAPMPCLFDDHRVVGNGVLMILLRDHRGAILEHGYKAPTHTVYATSTEGNRIAQIDWRPAFEVYQELVQQQSGVMVTPDNFYEHAVHFPFGIVRVNHHVVVRIPVMLADDGALVCVGEVPAHSVLTLLISPTVDSFDTLRTLQLGLQTLDGEPHPNNNLLLFYCAGRRLHLGLDRAGAELSWLADLSGSGAMAGAVSLGEIGGSTVHGYPLFQNACLLATRW